LIECSADVVFWATGDDDSEWEDMISGQNVNYVEELLSFLLMPAFVEAVDGKNPVSGDVHYLRYSLQGGEDETVHLLNERFLKYAWRVSYGPGNVRSKGRDTFQQLLGDGEDEGFRVVEVGNPRGEKV